MGIEGVLGIEGAPVDTVFIDPPALLGSGYDGVTLDSRAYYARQARDPEIQPSSKRKKRKRKKQAYMLNAKELMAEQRHKEARWFLLEAHKAFMCDKAAQTRLRSIVESNASSSRCQVVQEEEVDFVRLLETFQAPLYEITLLPQDDVVNQVKDRNSLHFPLFNSLIAAAQSREQMAICSGCTQETPSNAYNLLIIDPPWENKSVYRKSVYPTLPNKYFLSLPLQRLVHSDGAIIGLWITNREKLRQFVERELFPAWGLAPLGVWYWLKINEAGGMLSELDLTHHKPYECLLLAKVADSVLEGTPHLDKVKNLVSISLPGQHSRKPPLGLLLADLAPGPRPVKALELFAREMNAGWTSWGNEPLRFQSKNYFLDMKSAS